MKLLNEGTVTLAKWLRKQQDDDCTHVILRQRTADTDQHVHEWNLAEADDLDELAADIETRAQEDGKYFRGPTLYGVFAYTEVGKAHVDRTFLRRRSLEARERRIVELEERHFKMLELYGKLQSMQHKRDLEVLREQRADERTQFLKEKLDMLAPVLMNRLLGKNGNGSPALGEELMRQFLKSLAPDPIDAPMSMLRPEQAAVIILHQRRALARSPRPFAISRAETASSR